MEEVNERQMKVRKKCRRREAEGVTIPDCILPLQTKGALRGDPHLDEALVYFISCFRSTFLSEQHGMPPPASRLVRKEDGEEAMLHDDADSMETSGVMQDQEPFFDSFADDQSGPKYTPVTPKQKMFQEVFDAIGMGFHTDVATLMINKLANNLRVWHDEPEVIKCTLDMWEELSQTYSSGKLLLSLGAVKYLLQNHTEEHFRFLTVPELGRQRTTFYRSLSRVVYLDDAPDR
jgi:hypothetical protein